MSFLKKRWYIPVAALVTLCGVIGLYVVTTAQQPAEPKTVYDMPEPNPERAEILKRATTPKNNIVEGVAPPADRAASQGASRETEEHEIMLTEHNQPVIPQNEDGDAAPVSQDSGQSEEDDTVAEANATLSQLEAEYSKLMQDAAPMMEQAYDLAAEELRPLTIAKRLRYLESMRMELENDADEDADPAEEAELNDLVINNFIAAMNERGVYFE